LADVFPHRVRAIQLDRIKAQNFDRPNASQALDAKQLTWDFR
jgi:hypothetical protein